MKNGSWGVFVVALVILFVAISVAGFGPLGWIKGIFTGNVIDSGYTCGVYSLQSAPSVSPSSTGNGGEATVISDGNTNTFWISKAGSSPQWVYFDLGEKKCVSAVNVYVSSFYTPVSYDLQISNGQGWKTVVSNWQISSASGSTYVLKSFAPESARFIRLVNSQAASGTSSYTASFSEVQIRVAQQVAIASGGGLGFGSGGGSGAVITPQTAQNPVTSDVNPVIEGESGVNIGGGSPSGGGNSGDSGTSVDRSLPPSKSQNKTNVTALVSNESDEESSPSTATTGSTFWWWLSGLIILLIFLIILYILWKRKRDEVQQSLDKGQFA